MDNILEIDSLTKYYKKTLAVDNLSFSLTPGQVLCCLGPNGAGKTTTLKMLAGLLKPTSGKVLISGREIKVNNFDFRSRCGVLLEDAGFYGELTGLEYLRFFASLFGLTNSGKRIQHLLERFQLWDYRNKLLRAYSKGMVKKVLLSASLLHEPDILLLDEPCTGLDLESKVEIINIIKGLQIEKSSIFVCTHDVNVVEELESAVLILNQGRNEGLKTREEISGLFSKMRKTIITFSDDGISYIENRFKNVFQHERFLIEKNRLIFISENSKSLLSALKKELQIQKNVIILKTESNQLPLQEFYKELCTNQ